MSPGLLSSSEEFHVDGFKTKLLKFYEKCIIASPETNFVLGNYEIS